MLEKKSLITRCREKTIILFVWLAVLTLAGMTAVRVYAAESNSMYSLEGAEYQLYTDSACTVKATAADGSNAVLITDENGDSEAIEIAAGTYYAKEIKASRGHKLDVDENGKPNVYTIEVTESDTESDPATFTSTEPPVYGVPDFMILKTDPDGEFSYEKLLGAKFTVKYYAVESRDKIAETEPRAEWTFVTAGKEISGGTYKAGIDWQNDEPVSYSHKGGKAFYEATVNGKTKRVLPLGWFTIEEEEAPPGFIRSERICYGHIYQPEAGGDAVTEIEGLSKDTGVNKDTLVFVNQPEPEISTKASPEDGNHQVKDIISYKYLLPNENYVFRGWLVDTLTGKKIPGSDGKTTLKTGSKTSGQVAMTLSTDGYENMQGYRMTAFEELYQIRREGDTDKEILVAEHKDLNDSDQTVEIYQDLKVRKNVTGNLGDISKTFQYKAEFSGLVPNKSYKIEGADEKTFNADASGNASVPLKLMDDQSVTVNQLPKGATYKITETASDHVAEFKVFSEDMAEKGAKIIKASGSNGADAAKDLSTALETVDLFDGTVVICWENNRDLATLTAVQTYTGIRACAFAGLLAGIALLLAKRTKEIDEQEEQK